MAPRDISSSFPPLPLRGRGACVGGEGAINRRPLTVTTLPAARRDQAARIWAGLLDQSGADELTTSWLWIGIWLDAYGAHVPHRFLVAHDPASGDPVAITLATSGRGQRRGPLPVRTAHLGTAGEGAVGDGGIGGVYVEHNRVLALPGHRPAALRAFTDALATPWWKVWDQVDYVELNGFAPEELEGWDAPGFVRDVHVCRVVDLDALRVAGTPLDKAFGSQIGRKLRKNARWFTERYGPVATEWITTAERGQQAFTELIDLHQARWVAAGEPGSFASAPLVTFHRAMIDALLPLGRIVMVRVTAGEQLVGVSYSFDEHGALNHYQWGLMEPAPEENSLSPGFVTALALLTEGLARGYREVNWLGGDSRWKRELSTTTRDLVWAERPTSPWATAVASAILTKHRIRPVVRVLRSPLPPRGETWAGGEGASVLLRLRALVHQPVFSRSSYGSARGLSASGGAVDPIPVDANRSATRNPQPETGPEVPR